MRFSSIYLKESGEERLITFSESNNLIHSSENSKGKTTLLRLLLYSIGYNIPNTKNIKFENCEVEVCITTDDGDLLSLKRTVREFIVLKNSEGKTTFMLPSQIYDLHKIIFKADNIDLINNILGTFYFDQEKGWTLLNRGVVIGSIRFNIEELIRGINNVDCSELILRKDKKRQDLLKFKQMFSVSKYQETLDNESKSLASESYNTIIDSRINQYKIQQNSIKRELSRVDDALKNNQHFRKFVADIGLLVQLQNGEIIAVTDKNIVGLNDTINYLIAKKRILSSEYNRISSELVEINKEKIVEQQQLSFLDDQETITKIFDSRIASIPINTLVVERQIANIEREISEINRNIRMLTRTGKGTITSLFNNAKKYLTELGLDGESISEKYLFTSNLKELTGAILHKTVFSFRLACLIETEKYLGVRLTIILDSPRGKEIDPLNIKKMINILKRDFSDNQIIIASIFEYDLESVNRIEIKHRLIEQE